jgi:GNAT superfamily N-acetyltransferase
LGVALQAPQRLSPHHKLSGFSCGVPTLDNWLQNHALQVEAAGTARTFVVWDANDAVVGYYSLANGSVVQEHATERVRKGTGKFPIPVILLARLAVSAEHQSLGIGHGLLKDAVSRVAKLCEDTGIRALAVHVIDEPVKSFYSQYGFQESPFEPNLLMILLKDLRLYFN